MKRNRMKRIMSVLLTFALLFGAVQGTSVLSVGAEETIPTVSAGDTWHAVWTAEEYAAFATLNITESGFYRFNVTDNSPNDNFLTVVVYNVTEDALMETVNGELGSTEYVDDILYFNAACEYEIGAVKYNSAGYFDSGDLSIAFNKAEIIPNELTLSQPVELSAFPDSRGWVSFEPEEAGDYCLSLSRAASFTVAVYDASTGLRRELRSTSYRTATSGKAIDKLVVNLEANTPYLFFFRKGTLPYEGYELSVEKCAEEIVHMELNEQTRDLLSVEYDEIDVSEALFNYRVVYADGTEAICTYEELAKAGRFTPNITYLGESISIYDSIYYGARTQPIEVEYLDRVEYDTVYIKPIHTYSNGYHYEGTPIHLSKSSFEQESSSRILPEETGVYGVFSSDWEYICSLSFIMIDEDNQQVVYDESKGGFPLVGGHTYVLETMSIADTSVSITLENINTVLFPDTHPSGWYYDAVTYVVGRNIMTGYQSGLFGTSDSIQRQDFLVMLARLDGVNLQEYAGVHGLFPDVAPNSYYEAAVTWGYANGIVSGYQNGEFGVGDKITREQLVTFLYRYAYYRYYDIECTAEQYQAVADAYNDYSRVTDFAQDAVVWAIDRGVISGKNPTTIAPQGDAQRCEVAQMMYNIFVNDII